MDENSNRLLWIGRLKFTGGYATVTNNYLKAIKKAGIGCASIDSQSSEMKGAASCSHFWFWNSKQKIFTTNDNLVVVINEVPKDFDKVKCKGKVRLIGCTLFENDSIPIDWLNYFNYVDEIWVPTHFNYKTFSNAGVPKEKLKVIPYCLDTEFYSPNITPLKIERLNKFKFLYIVSTLSRKDVGLLIRSYYKAFKSNDEVTLIIKILSKSSHVLDEIINSVKPEYEFGSYSLPHVYIIQDNMSNEKLKQLYKLCDVYATTERAKGWDYPAMEAMAMEKPIISINWSGSTEFLNSENSFLIEPENNLIDVDKGLITNLDAYIGQSWPEVKEDKVIKILHEAYQRKDLRKQYGILGRKQIVEHYSISKVGSIISDVVKNYKPNSFRGTTRAKVKLFNFSHLNTNNKTIPFKQKIIKKFMFWR
jgi:glycosyltransferase involved in cell wall biosynthesis